MLAVAVWVGRQPERSWVTSNIECSALIVEPGMKDRGLGIKGLMPSSFWVCLVMSAVFAGMMEMTASRGAVVALGAGFLVLLWAAGLPRPRGRQMAGIFGVLVALGVLVGFGRMGERVVESSGEDGSITSRVEIFRVDEGVQVGTERPKVWCFAPDIAVLGKAYGKAIRNRESVGAAWDMEEIRKALPSEIVLSGSAPIRADDRFSQCCTVTWLNPPARLDVEQQRILEMAAKKIIIWGEHRSDANPSRLKAWFEGLPGGQWIFVRGRGLFLGASLGGQADAEAVFSARRVNAPPPSHEQSEGSLGRSHGSQTFFPSFPTFA